MFAIVSEVGWMAWTPRLGKTRTGLIWKELVSTREEQDMSLTEAFQLAQALASIATVVLVILTWQQIRLVRKQATTTFEDSLTTQYRSIMENIPTDIWLGLQLKTLDNARQDQCRDAIYRYLDLSNEQAFLHIKKRITDEAWNEWSDGIKVNMKLPAFKEVWAEVVEKCPKSFEELRAVTGQMIKT